MAGFVIQLHFAVVPVEYILRKSLHGTYYSFDTSIYPFKEALEKLFGCELGYLHEHLGHFNEFSREKDQSTLAHKVFYANYDSALSHIYEKFIYEIVRPIINETFFYQRIPTFRVGLPGNRFVGEYHTDSKYNHKPYEINFNLGLANYDGPCSLKVFRTDEQDSYDLFGCNYGQIFCFDHIDRLHGSETNKTNKTMASIDFRLALSSLYFEDADARSVNMGSEFKPGSYFSPLAI